jgi:PHD/YefM family antitoxin component YafN of YafNO toxin-antitoxin module
MPIKTMSSREFNQAASRAKQAAKKGPVFITDRGRTTHVLLNVDEYNKLASRGKDIVELLRMPDDTPKFDFDPPRLGDLAREIDLS